MFIQVKVTFLTSSKDPAKESHPKVRMHNHQTAEHNDPAPLLLELEGNNLLILLRVEKADKSLADQSAEFHIRHLIYCLAWYDFTNLRSNPP